MEPFDFATSTPEEMIDHAVTMAMNTKPETLLKAQQVAEHAIKYIEALRVVADKEAQQIAGPNLVGMLYCQAFIRQAANDPEQQRKVDMILGAQSVQTVDRIIASLQFAILMVPDGPMGKDTIDLFRGFRLAYTELAKKRGTDEEYKELADWVEAESAKDQDTQRMFAVMVSAQSVVTMDEMMKTLRTTIDRLGLVLDTRTGMDII